VTANQHRKTFTGEPAVKIEFLDVRTSTILRQLFGNV